MILVETTSTPSVDLPLAEFRAHLRLGTGFGEDTLQNEVLESYLRAALAAIEARTGKMLFQRRVSWTLTRWSKVDAQALPVAPVTRIENVSLTDASGAETIVDGAVYTLIRDTHRPQIAAVGAGLPTVPQGGSVTVTFDAGHGPQWTQIPPDLREAVFLLASHYYENRFDTSGAGGLMPFGVMALLDAHRNIRIFEVRA